MWKIRNLRDLILHIVEIQALQRLVIIDKNAASLSVPYLYWSGSNYRTEIACFWELLLRWVMWSFYFPHGKHICAIWRHGVTTNSGDSYGHKLCSTHSEFVFICYERDFMSNLHKSQQYDLIDMLNDTSRYLDGIFIIDNRELRNIFLI